MMRILIGYNGSEAANAALHDLRCAGLPDKTEAIVLAVAESWQPPKTAYDAVEVAAAGKTTVLANFPTWIVKAETASGAPPREILAKAESFQPDLIIVGEPRQAVGGGHIFIGHTSQTILTEAECSVRIARGCESSISDAKRILIGFDGSAGAAGAVDSIVRRKWPADTSVRLLAVADSSVLTSIGRFTPQMNDAVVEAKFVLQWAETLAVPSLMKLKAAGIASSVEVRFGHPKDVIVDEAEQWNADTIFVGPHCAPNSFERFLIGSVSAAVAARAHCSVEIVRK